jgi:hypothetical protein
MTRKGWVQEIADHEKNRLTGERGYQTRSPGACTRVPAGHRRRRAAVGNVFGLVE